MTQCEYIFFVYVVCAYFSKLLGPAEIVYGEVFFTFIILMFIFYQNRKIKFVKRKKPNNKYIALHEFI